MLRDEIVLSGRVSLHNVSTLSTDVQILNTVSVNQESRTVQDLEDMGTILESTGELAGIHSQLMAETILVLDVVILNWGVVTVEVGVQESLLDTV